MHTMEKGLTEILSKTIQNKRSSNRTNIQQITMVKLTFYLLVWALWDHEKDYNLKEMFILINPV